MPSVARKSGGQPVTHVAGFELVRCVSQHEVASVYEGRRDASRVAVKIYGASWCASGGRQAREERIGRQLSHPCIARSLATERLADGSFAVVSEWIEGTTLEEQLAGGPIRWERAVALLHAVARGLAAIHATGVVHRDLKPSNVIVPSSGDPAAVVIDFSHALVIGDARITDTGIVLGSARYMAPEQAYGLPLDARADLYAVGVMLYRMLVGRLPFDHASPAEVMLMHQCEPVPPLSMHTNAPRAVQDLCSWLLVKDPARRVPNAHVLRVTLEALGRTPPSSREVTE